MTDLRRDTDANGHAPGRLTSLDGTPGQISKRPMLVPMILRDSLGRLGSLRGREHVNRFTNFRARPRLITEFR
jgi:hypothetical protein